jgi:NAD(P)-dependent dehydrogenase (short-subunit alcohol dehydrogenase family)
MSVYDIFDIKGRKAMVTGAARGIGKVLAIALAQAGCDVALLDLHKESLSETAAEIKKLGRKALVLSGDISVKDDVVMAFSIIKQEFGRLDICLNNAGISMQVPVEKMAEEDWDKIIDINMKGTFFCSQEAAKMMMPNKTGSIINIGSISARIVNLPQPQAAYNTSKAGVVMLTKTTAVEWAPHGIRVNAISPGYMKTEMTLSSMSHLFPTWEGMTPMKRLGVPEELRGALIFLASDASSYMTGHDLVVDGGYTII